VLTTTRLYLNPMRREPGELTEGELVGRVYQQARCAVSRVEPDQWFPVAMDVTKARDQAADAIAVCAACPVRADCLEFALRHGSDVGAHGIWGGLVEAERLYLRHRWLAGTSVAEFLREVPVPAQPVGGWVHDRS
jgi:WhiB family redox-sensing transcriptional regulator